MCSFTAGHFSIAQLCFQHVSKSFAREKSRQQPRRALAGKIDIFYVLPDYYETRPKPCLNGWGQRYLTVNPIGDVLPARLLHRLSRILRFENVRTRALD
mgnify:CR=1 FL=1